MPRELHADFSAELVKPVMRPVLFFKGFFAQGNINFWSGRGIYQWQGEDWVGAGGVLGLSEPTESADLRSTELRIELSGVNNPDIVAIARRHAKMGCRGLFWFGAVKDDRTIVLNPALVFEGKLDVPTISTDGKTCIISVSYVSELIELKRPRLLYATHEQQQIRKPGDMFFQYTAALINQVVSW